MKRRKEFMDLIAANTKLTYNRYWCLVALASIDFCLTIPIALWALIVNGAILEVYPWVSWADTHWGYSRVLQYPRSFVLPIIMYSLETSRWSAVLCAFVFFGFFGFSEEARRNYRLWMRFLKSPSRFSTPRQAPPTPDSFKYASQNSSLSQV